MVEGLSVRRIRDNGEGADLDIFWEGSWRDITLLTGAATSLASKINHQAKSEEVVGVGGCDEKDVTGHT